jgi:RimJ/RimL family protein N-acetyltransferase
MKKQELYNEKAIKYAERYGIVTYRLKGKYLIYNQNYKNTEFIDGKWRDNHCTYQRTVDLETLQETSKKLERLQRNGWDNV